jgi:hypothetical protein
MHKQLDIQKIKAIRSNDQQDWLSLRKMRSSVKHAIIRGKKSISKHYFRENKDNPKKTWNILSMNLHLRFYFSNIG